MSQIHLDSLQSKTLEFLKICPRTPTQVSIHLKLSREHTQRAVLKPLIESGKIVIIEGTHLYQIKGFSIEKKSVDRLLAQGSKFDDCQTIKNWRGQTTRLDRENLINQWKLICLGSSRYTPTDFKINPDSWVHPEDTKKIIQVVQEHMKNEKLPNGFKVVLRQFLIFGLQYPLLEAESIRLGIPLPKGKPQYSRLECNITSYNQILDSLESNEKMFCDFGFGYGTFCRPSTQFTVKCDDLFFFDRTIEFIELPNGKLITNPEQIEGLRNKFEVQTKIQRAIDLEIFEFKTEVLYPKNIFDERVVKRLESYVTSRKHQGFKYLFWDDNKTVFTKQNYRKITQWTLRKQSKFYTKIFFAVGFKQGDFGVANRASYAKRHFGVQWWLQNTDYDYGLIADMGWDDITTLKNWYGGMTSEHRLKKIAGVFFN